MTAFVTPGPEVTRQTPDLVARPRVAVRRVRRALLVPDQDVLDLVLLEELVVDEEHRAAGIPEDVLRPLGLQAADDDLGAGEFGGDELGHLVPGSIADSYCVEYLTKTVEG